MKKQTTLNPTVPLPVLPIRGQVLFPSLQVTLDIGRSRSLEAVRRAAATGGTAFVVTQRHPKVEEPGRSDLFEVGTLAQLLDPLPQSDGPLRIRMVGDVRARLLDLKEDAGCLMAEVTPLLPERVQPSWKVKLEALRRLAARDFEMWARKGGRLSPEFVAGILSEMDLERFSDRLSDALFISVEEKQDLLELAGLEARMTRLTQVMHAELEILRMERKIQSRVHKQIETNQKEYYLNEQMRAIQKELKKKDENGQELEDLKNRIKELGMEPESEELSLRELGRLEKMMPFSPEATVIRSYLEWVIALPWSVRTEDHLDVPRARAILAADHYGLEKPKERILEYLAVLKLTASTKGPILCFVGPPGTGKTSLAKSMARALGRKFYRISLGGVRDEAEIRGHRRTYIGSMPGRIIQAFRKAKSRNPVILLDEMDKMGSDWRGDPSSALLEVLDPEQHKTFLDHYLDIPFDVSETIFIGTANSLYDIPATLRDRLEVIRFSAYTTEEKVKIAKTFLLPKELKEHGLGARAITPEDDALRKIIHLYTQEAGVRDLERKVARICRKIAVEEAEGGRKKGSSPSRVIAPQDLHDYLGPAEFVRAGLTANAIGVATGLAYTDHGGETLTIEVTSTPGKNKVILTGKLGAVMQESAQTALSLVKSWAGRLGLDPDRFEKQELHIHVPEGAVPKDGPSAGTAIATAIASALMGVAVRPGIAMTGEVTLRGRVLPIGGLKDKVLAAAREGIKTVLYPEGNEKDVPEIPEDVRKAVSLISVKTIDDIFRLALAPVPATGAVERAGAPVPLRAQGRQD